MAKKERACVRSMNQPSVCRTNDTSLSDAARLGSARRSRNAGR
jgi:hypothetical protein